MKQSVELIFLKKELKKYLAKLEGKRLALLHKYAPEKAAERCLKLFITPRRGEIKKQQEPFLQTAKKEVVTSGGLQIQTYLWPKGGEKVLLVHGWESNTARWKDLIIRLQAENYSVISIDAPAHGSSGGRRFSVPLYGEAIRDIVEKFNPQSAIGHSIGGTTLLYQHYRQSFPYIERMVLLAPASEMIGLMKDFQKTLGLKHDLMRTFEKRFKKEFGYNFAEFSMLELTKSFEITALWIHDKNDKIVNYQETLPVVEQWNNAELLLTEGLGHGLKSEFVYEAVLKFLKAN